ncbi:PREDICTED: chorion class B protein PC10-like [Papilio polytes]|uniref:chorion class B protein PC10-like n=1 Tax=Papilio polytes TaxID=76194 RepID=UPI0006767F3E|nr:PREDICTED: chorion class B protein PC10-like [Papilio polytes]
MSSTIAALCVFGCLVSSLHGQCVPLSAQQNAWGVRNAGCGCALAGADSAASALAAADGGGFAVVSSSPTPPHGVSVVSDNEYSGIVAVLGQLPFLGTTYLEGAVPSAGAGAVAYGCGYGDVAILNEDFADATVLGNNGLNFGRSYNELRGCGCGFY